MHGRRLTAYYVVLIAAVAVVVTLVLSIGSDKHAQPGIAGGYDVSAGQACLGEQVQVTQSGQFVGLEHADGSGAGKLRFKTPRLTGDATCAKGGTRPLNALVHKGTIAGTVGREPLKAVFARDPPDPGAPKPSPPTSIAGDYKYVPRSACLGGKGTFEGRSVVQVKGNGVSGTLRYGDDGKLAGTVTCLSGKRAAVAGAASNRDVNLTIGPEKVTAQKQREFGHALAVFFIAIAVVMLCARLVGTLAVRLGQPRVMGEVIAGILARADVLRRDLARAPARPSSPRTSSRLSGWRPTSG